MSVKIKGLLVALIIVGIVGAALYLSGVFTKKTSYNRHASSVSTSIEAQNSGIQGTSARTGVGPLKNQDFAPIVPEGSFKDDSLSANEGLDTPGQGDGSQALSLSHEADGKLGAESEKPSTLVPPLVNPPAQQGAGNRVESDGKVVRVTVDNSLTNETKAPTILGTTSISDGTPIPSSQDTVIPFTLIQNIARDLVSGYWPQGTHVLASSKGVTTTTFAFLNSRYGTNLSGKFSAYAETGLARQGLLDYILMPSMVDGLYKLYAERFIRLLNQEAAERAFMRQEAAVNLTHQEISEMYGLYAQSLKSNAGCIRGFVRSGEIRHATDVFVLAEQEATAAHMDYQEHSLEAENGGNNVSAKVEQQYQLRVAERESARQNLAAAFRRFTDTRNMDTSDLVFLAKWLNRRSMAHDDGLLALAITLENLAARMEREQQRYIKQ